MNPFDSPDDELHLAPASCVHQDRYQLRVPRTKDAMRPDGNCEETLVLVTSLEDQLQHSRVGRKHSTLHTAKQRRCKAVFSLLSVSDCEGHGTDDAEGNEASCAKSKM